MSVRGAARRFFRKPKCHTALLLVLFTLLRTVMRGWEGRGASWEGMARLQGSAPTEGPAAASQMPHYKPEASPATWLIFCSTQRRWAVSDASPSFLSCNKGYFIGRSISNSRVEKLCIQYFWGMMGGNNYTAAQPVALVLSDCLANFQRKASSHYRNYRIIWLFLLPLRYRISFTKTFLFFPAFRTLCTINS